MSFKKNLKGITVAYNNSFRIIHNRSPRCSASHMFATNYVKSFNERIRSSIFSVYAGWKNPTIYFLWIIFTLLFIIKVHWLNIVLIYCMLLIHDVCTFIQIYFFILILYFTTRHVCIFIYIYFFLNTCTSIVHHVCICMFILTCMYL